MSKLNKRTTLEGKLLAFNYSPKGSYEGMLLDTAAGIVQVNFSSDIAEDLSSTLKGGAPVYVEAEPFDDDRPGEHPVYQLHSLLSKEGKAVHPGAGAFEGKVVRLNYAKHGEANGAVLDSGDFVHVKPHGARLLGLEIGQMLEGDGKRKPLHFGQGSVIEAVSVNGTDVDKKHAVKKIAKKAPAKKAVKKAAKKIAK